MKPTQMTTTELIELLKSLEFGGATGRPREISFWIGDKKYRTLELTSTGDGLFTTIDFKLTE